MLFRSIFSFFFFQFYLSKMLWYFKTKATNYSQILPSLRAVGWTIVSGFCLIFEFLSFELPITLLRSSPLSMRVIKLEEFFIDFKGTTIFWASSLSIFTCPVLSSSSSISIRYSFPFIFIILQFFMLFPFLISSNQFLSISPHSSLFTSRWSTNC